MPSRYRPISVTWLALLAFGATGCADVLGADFDGMRAGGSAGGQNAAAGGTDGVAGAGPGGGASSAVGGSGGGGGFPTEAALSVTCGSMAGLQPGSPWPMAGYCPTRQGRSPARSFTSPKLVWRAKLDGQIQTEPVVAADGTVYVATVSGSTQRLYAVRDGAAVWFYETTGPSSPAIGADGSLYLLTGSGLVALTSTGQFRWSVPATACYGCTPVIGSDGTIYVVYGSKLLAVRADGEAVWTVPTGKLLQGSVALGPDGTVYAAHLSGTLLAHDRQGVYKWQYYPGDGHALESGPVIVDLDNILLSTKSRVFAVNAYGDEKWSQPVGVALSYPPVVWGDTVIFQHIADTDRTRTLRAFDTKGTQLWSAVRDGIAGRPTLTADGVLISAVSGRPGVMAPEIVLTTAKTGNVGWSYAIESQHVTSWPAVAYGSDGRAYAALGDTLVVLESAR